MVQIEDMNPTDITLIILSIALFLLTPTLPSSLFNSIFVSSLGAAALLLALLISTSYSRVGSVFLLLAVVGIYVEYRRRVLKDVAEVSYEKQMEPAQPIVPTEIHPPFEAPSEDLVGYKPTGNATDEFEPVGPSINQKGELSTSRLPEQAEKFLIDSGLAEAQSAY